MRLLAAILLMAAPCPHVAVAQQKKPATQTQQKKPAQTQQKKPAAQTQQKKPAQPQQKKPAAQTQQKKPAQPQQKKPTQTQQKKPAAPAKKLSRAEYEKQQRDLQKQIEATQRMINDNDKSVRSRRRDIQLREEEIGKRRALIVSMQYEIEAMRQEEDSLQQAIAQQTRTQRAKQQKYAAAVRHLYRWRSGYDEILFILSAGDMLEAMRRVRYLRQYSAWRRHEAEQLQAARRRTEAARSDLARTKSERQALLGAVEAERQALQQKQAQQNAEVSNLQKRRKELAQDLERDKKRQQEVQRQIQALIDEERRKADEERRKAELAARKKAEAEAAAGKAPAPGKTPSGTSDAPAPYKPDDAYTRLTGTFRQNKGRMPYPVDTQFAFLQHYKQRQDGNLSIRLSTGVAANACAVFEGKVTRCSRSDEDWTVIVSHGDYMTVYSNLQDVSVREGETVKMRQAIGKVKPDTDGRRGELMFWIYNRNDAENPELWLRK